MKAKRSFFMSCAVVASLAASGASIPSVEKVKLFQNPGQRMVKISYTLKDGPAVVTMDIQTNGTDSGWVSIGVDTIYAPGSYPKGDVNKPVEAGDRLITWRPAKTWTAEGDVVRNARAVLTAWPLDDKPPYMVVDVSQGGANSADRIRYYASEDALPGGLLRNEAYRKTALVLKKVIAKDIAWTMGGWQEFGRNNSVVDEKSHRVTLAHNYYLGVFPITQAQCTNIWGRTWDSNFSKDGEMRARDYIRYDTWQPYARGPALYPAPPSSDSLLGLLRTRTANAVDFDLPPEACWEFACRAGTREGYWNTGKPLTANSTDGTVLAHDANMPGRYLNNQAVPGNKDRTTVGPESGTPIVGSYEPNAWGFYDMHGGVYEWCLDWFQDDITALNGEVNVSADGTTRKDGSTTTYRVIRGGSWASSPIGSRSTYRAKQEGVWPGDNQETGMRVYCRAGLM